MNRKGPYGAGYFNEARATATQLSGHECGEKSAAAKRLNGLYRKSGSRVHVVGVGSGDLFADSPCDGRDRTDAGRGSCEPIDHRLISIVVDQFIGDLHGSNLYLTRKIRQVGYISLKAIQYHRHHLVLSFTVPQ